MGAMGKTGVLVVAALLGACADDAAERPAAEADRVRETDPVAAVDDTTAALPRVSDPAISRWLERVEPAVFTRWGACPFECCIYRDWLAQGAVVVRAQPDASAAVVVTLPAGTRFQADTGFVRITGPQLVIVTRDVPEAWVHQPGRRDGGRQDTISAGDTLLVLEHLGEGHVMMTHGSDLVSAEQFWPSADGWTPYGGPRGRVIGEHAAEWWARVRTSDGTTGWIDAYGSELGNVDACGMPE